MKWNKTLKLGTKEKSKMEKNLNCEQNFQNKEKYFNIGEKNFKCGKIT